MEIDPYEKLHTRVSDVEKSYVEVRNLIEMREERSKDIHDKVDSIYKVLIGEGDQTSPSIVVRVDRLERTSEDRRYLFGIVVVLVINAAWQWLKMR